MTPERLDWHLENWQRYCKAGEDLQLGYPSKSLVMLSGGASCAEEFDIMCEEVDIHCAEKMDAIIDSLSKPQQTAINHVWLQVSHHYPTQELDYVEAIERLHLLVIKRKLT